MARFARVEIERALRARPLIVLPPLAALASEAG